MSGQIDAVQEAPVSQLREWRRVAIVLLLVLSPTIVATIIGMSALEALAWKIGETVPMGMIADWQSGGPDRIWRGGDGQSYLTYKVARVRKVRPEVIMLGASRANSFRAEMFKPYSFYNAGLTAFTFDHYLRFLRLITSDGYAPKTLIFNFDYWMFSQDYDRYWVARFYEHPTSHFSDLKIVLDGALQYRLNLWHRLYLTEHAKGLYAVLSDEGFRADGSLFGQPSSADPARLMNDGTGVGAPPVELADHIAPNQMKRFEDFVAFARSKNIGLIGVQLPMYKKILDGLNSNPRAGIWREFRSAEWHSRFEQEGIVFFDFADMPEYRDRPEYFIDSLHPDAKVLQGVMARVLTDPRVKTMLPAIPDGSE